MTMKPTPDRSKSLDITGDSAPVVPAYTCKVYIRKNENGTVTGRVANLAGLEASGAGERDVLLKLTREFKSRISQILTDGEDIPWIDPPQPRQENEQMRSIPVHL